jgi:hypothetical protein
MRQPPLPASDVRERFLLAIAGVIAPDRLVTLHFFPPIRQGPMESGVAVIAVEPETSSESRHVVFSARYRWTRKGPERGKWEHEIIAEADAPLITVEAVVCGVRERADEEFEAERMTGDEARTLIAEAEARRLRAAS